MTFICPCADSIYVTSCRMWLCRHDGNEGVCSWLWRHGRKNACRWGSKCRVPRCVPLVYRWGRRCQGKGHTTTVHLSNAAGSTWLMCSPVTRNKQGNKKMFTECIKHACPFDDDLPTQRGIMNKKLFVTTDPNTLQAIQNVCLWSVIDFLPYNYTKYNSWYLNQTCPKKALHSPTYHAHGEMENRNIVNTREVRGMEVKYFTY